MTHLNVVALVAGSKPLVLSLGQRFCKFSTGIDKYGSDVLKTVVNVAQSNPFSVYCNNYHYRSMYSSYRGFYLMRAYALFMYNRSTILLTF